MKLAAQIAIALLAAALLGGCGGYSNDGSTGGSSTQPPAGTSTAPAGASARACPVDAAGAEGLRATGISCGEAQRVVAAWQRGGSCAPPPGASRAGCEAAGYRCLGTATDRGFAVGCSQPGRSVAFVVKR
jgi:hypothetical protein